MTYLKWILITLCALFVVAVGSGYIVAMMAGDHETRPDMPETGSQKAKKSKGSSIDPSVMNAKLKARLKAFEPKGIYVVIDTGANELYLKKNGEVVRRCIVSSGSGNVLEDTKVGKKWVFDTPRGEYEVKSKAVQPNWIKPDWAFVEEGEAAPKSYKDRVEEGVLGDYALGFGNGYFIHGTLYTRMLGRNVTHGCVRMGDEDLEAVFRTAPMGTKIYIF